MRPKGVNDVFVANVNLRQEAGLYSDNLDDPPKASSWLDKKIAKVDKDVRITDDFQLAKIFDEAAVDAIAA